MNKTRINYNKKSCKEKLIRHFTGVLRQQNNRAVAMPFR